MALTKVKLIADGVITSANLDASHGITTSDIGEGSNLYYTDSRVSSYLSTNGFATQTDIVAAITDSAPVTLDTLNELAAALGDDPNFATTTATSLGLKAPLASPSFTGNATFAGSVGIGAGPSNKLHIQQAKSGSSAENYDLLRFNLTGTGAIGDSSSIVWYSTSGTKTAGIEGISGQDNILYGELAFNVRKYTTDSFDEVMRINNRGNVGINETSPATVLDVRGSGANTLPATTGTTPSTGTRFRVASTGSASAVLDFGISTGGKSWLQVTDRTDLSIEYPFLINPNGGNVGIGIDNPANLLHIKKTGFTRGTFEADGDNQVGIQIIRSNSSNNTNWEIYSPASSTDLRFFNGGDRVTLDSSGNVGINTDDPQAKLEVKQNGNNTRFNSADANGPYITFANNGTAKGYIGSAYHLFAPTPPDGDDLGIRAQNDLIFSAGGAAEKMRIDSSGNVTIGNATYGSSLGQLRIINDAASNPASLSLFGYNNIDNDGGFAHIDFAMQSSGTGGNITASIRGRANGTGENASDLAFYTATGGTLSERMRIDSIGRVGIGADPADWAFNTGGGSLRIGSNGHIQDDSNSTYYAHNLYYNAGWKFLDSNAHPGNYILMADDGSMQFANTTNTGTSGQAATVVERMRITSAGIVEFKYGIDIRPGTYYSQTYSYTSSWASDFQTIVPAGTLDGSRAYMLIIWSDSFGTPPYYASATTTFTTAQSTNASGDSEPIDLLTSHHVNSSVYWQVRTTTSGNSTNGLQAKLVNGPSVSSVDIYVRITQIADF